MKLPSLSVIFPNYNGGRDPLDLIKSVCDSDYPREKLEIIIVDNASTDSSLSQIARFPSIVPIRIIRNSTNRGTAAARNQGAKIARGKYLFFCDNDSLLAKNTLSALMVYRLTHPEAVILGPKILRKKDRSPIFTGYRWHRWLAVEKGSRDLKHIQEVDWVPACGLIVGKNDFWKIGGFDEEFFFFAEDADFCLRAKKLGMKIVYNPEITAYHGRTTPETFSPEEKRKEYYRAKAKLAARHICGLGGIISLLVIFFCRLSASLDNPLRRKSYPSIK